jgi:hypothetical protein
MKIDGLLSLTVADRAEKRRQKTIGDDMGG